MKNIATVFMVIAILSILVLIYYLAIYVLGEISIERKILSFVFGLLVCIPIIGRIFNVIKDSKK